MARAPPIRRAAHKQHLSGRDAGRAAVRLQLRQSSHAWVRSHLLVTSSHCGIPFAFSMKPACRRSTGFNHARQRESIERMGLAVEQAHKWATFYQFPTTPRSKTDVNRSDRQLYGHFRQCESGQPRHAVAAAPYRANGSSEDTLLAILRDGAGAVCRIDASPEAACLWSSMTTRASASPRRARPERSKTRPHRLGCQRYSKFCKRRC